MRHFVALAALLVAGLSAIPAARAGDAAAERADLATIIRELNLIDRLALDAQAAAPSDDRYHFDYARLEADLARVRGGINDYLTPPRAQPRDAIVLSGDYRRESEEPLSHVRR
ncbi:MAG: RAQPRD family integrative conjugative element protein [Steroidobacteraceae bacterium]